MGISRVPALNWVYPPQKLTLENPPIYNRKIQLQMVDFPVSCSFSGLRSPKTNSSHLKNKPSDPTGKLFPNIHFLVEVGFGMGEWYP